MAERRVGVAVVNVNGSPLPRPTYDELIDARVEQSVHVPDRFSLRFRDPTFELVDGETFGIGTAIDILINHGRNDVPIVRGEVTAMAIEEGASGRHELVVSGLDRAHRLARGPHARTFVQMTDHEVVRSIAQERRLEPVVDSTGVRHDYLLQRGTDYQFIGERARAAGYSWWVSDDKLYFVQDVKVQPGSETLRYGENLVRFRVRASCAEAADEVVVRGWDPDNQRAIVASAPMGRPDAATLGTSARFAADALSGASKFGGGIRRGTGSVGVASSQEAEALARSLATSATSEYLVARGEALGNPHLRAGGEVTVSGIGRRLGGTYLLTNVEHVLGAGRQYVTRFVSGGRHPDSLVDLLGGPSRAPWWGEQGLVIGIVTNNHDPEGLGRIKVRFPTLSEEDESWWARVAAVGAGPQRGLSVLFEVGDEVLVAFEHGDLRRAIVLGGLWSKQHKPHAGGAETDASGVATRVWRSRTGHIVEMHDSDDPAGSFVSITLADGRTRLRLGEDDVTLESPTDVAITSQGNIRVTATRDLTLEGANVTVNAKQAVKIDGLSIAAKGTATAKLEGAQTEVKGSGAVTVQGGGVASLRGALVKLN